MARSLNKVMLIGNLGVDPEVRHTSSGLPVATFRMATSWTRGSEGVSAKRTRNGTTSWPGEGSPRSASNT